MRYPRRQGRLPLYRTAVFFDWHGVLCRDRFWHSILDAERHPAQVALQSFADELFSNEQLVRAWMRGLVSLDEVLQGWPTHHRRWNTRFLLRRAVRDCRRMQILPAMAARAHELSASCFVVVATDNMDCFADAARHHTGLNALFDDVICSSELGVLKRDDPRRFFSAFLNTIGGSLENSILVDDSLANCVAFSEAGGRVVHHREPERTRAELLELLLSNRSPSVPFCPESTRSPEQADR